ncbi:MAG: SH3 domain-containing protein [Saprospiraceae bacterium]|nr:SH3 domain-containing protein [Lewinella sp.]
MQQLKSSLLTFFVLGLLACGNNAAPAEENTSSESAPSELSSVQQDSLRQLYFHLLAAKRDTLPAVFIGEAGKLYPVDEALTDTSFFIFREQFLYAIRKKELFRLMDVIHPDIKVDFGGAGGVADFVQTWELDSPEKAANSRIWGILEKVLENGGAFTDGHTQFIAPYIFATWPQDSDAFEYWAITGSGVRLRSAPSLQSSTITMVSYDIVKYLETTEKQETIAGETHPWVKVELADGKQGYVYGKYAASSIDYRTAFERQPSGKWLMTFLVAGD